MHSFSISILIAFFQYLQTIEEESAKRIELMVKRRVEEELEKRRDEIETEVSRRVEAAKIQMEREMMIELEKRRENAREEERKREVNIAHSIITVVTYGMIGGEKRNAIYG